MQRRFLAQHSVATLFRRVTTLFQHCNAVLRIVPCNITFTHFFREELLNVRTKNFVVCVPVLFFALLVTSISHFSQITAAMKFSCFYPNEIRPLVFNRS